MLRIFCLIVGLMPLGALGQTPEWRFATVERPPFAFTDAAGQQTGFSIDLMQVIADELGATVEFSQSPTFPDMLARVEGGAVDGAIANISITAAREEVMDFSLPIFESGIQILAPNALDGPGLWTSLRHSGLGLWIGGLVVALLMSGLVMWLAERRHQAYFNRPFVRAIFPAFWWALVQVSGGGFEERMPRTALGRGLASLLRLGGLAAVALLVAQLATTMTVQSLTGRISAVSDLDGRSIGSTNGSTASRFLADRDLDHKTYADFAALMRAFEEGTIEAVVFDGPLLAHWLLTHPDQDAVLVDRVFKPEDYGIALPQGSALRDPIDQALLRLFEDGTYDDLRAKWFGRGVGR